MPTKVAENEPQFELIRQNIHIASVIGGVFREYFRGNCYFMDTKVDNPEEYVHCKRYAQQMICHCNAVIMSAVASHSMVWSRCRSKKTSKLRDHGLCERNSPVTSEFPAQRASNAENVSIWWRHHGYSSFLRLQSVTVLLVTFTAVLRHIKSAGQCHRLMNAWHIVATSTVYWCIASKLKALRNFYWMSNMFLWVEIFLFFVCYHVVPKRHCHLDYELND